MRGPDLHPEDLIERGAQGLLSDAERARLQTHMRECVACRLEQAVRSDFESDAMRDALDGALVNRFIAGLVPSPIAWAPTGLRRRPPVFRPAFAALAIALLAGAAAASVRLSGIPTGPRPILYALRSETPARIANPLPAASSPALDVSSPPIREDAPKEARPSPARKHALPPEQPPRIASATEDPQSASSLFVMAGTVRRGGDHERAKRLYQNLFSRYPESPEAHTSLAILGRMLLDDGDDDEALIAFERYLRSGGVLEQDAFLGQALALERLGRTADAVQAWSSLLRVYPDSVHAARARAHLVNLGNP